LKEFQNQPYVEHLSAKLKRILGEYCQINNKSGEDIPQKLFLHCYSLIESRTLYFATAEDPKSEVGAMIALYDMCNHAEEVN
jgi:hypothetical protein